MTDAAVRACYNCWPGLQLYRWLCPRCRTLYTFADGRMAVRKLGQPSVFELKKPQTLVQFVTGGKA